MDIIYSSNKLRKRLMRPERLIKKRIFDKLSAKGMICGNYLKDRSFPPVEDFMAPRSIWSPGLRSMWETPIIIHYLNTSPSPPLPLSRSPALPLSFQWGNALADT